MEGKRGTEAALSLFVCDEIESVVTGTELTVVMVTVVTVVTKLQYNVLLIKKLASQN